MQEVAHDQVNEFEGIQQDQMTEGNFTNRTESYIEDFNDLMSSSGMHQEVKGEVDVRQLKEEEEQQTIEVKETEQQIQEEESKEQTAERLGE